MTKADRTIKQGDRGEMDPYRHIDVVRVEECASCKRNNRTRKVVARKAWAAARHVPFMLALAAMFAFTADKYPTVNESPWWALITGFGGMFGVLVQILRAIIAATDAGGDE